METKALTTTTWQLDKAHSELLFKVKHLMITHVKGEFRDFDATVSTTGIDFQGAEIQAVVRTASIDTNHADRDAHLKSADFFDCDNHPTMTFAGKAYHISGSNYEIRGILTIKAISHPVTLKAEYGGIMKDPWGNEKCGFSFTGKISRSLWNITWNAALEAGGVLVSDEVVLMGEIQLSKL